MDGGEDKPRDALRKAECSDSMDVDQNKTKETLKKAADGLTKVWKPSKTVEPFYAGGKVFSV